MYATCNSIIIIIIITNFLFLFNDVLFIPRFLKWRTTKITLLCLENSFCFVTLVNFKLNFSYTCSVNLIPECALQLNGDLV